MVSLFFVISTVIELTIVVFLKRILDWESNWIETKNNVGREESNKTRLIGNTMSYFEVIDLLSLAMYFIIFIIFNCAYWNDDN